MTINTSEEVDDVIFRGLHRLSAVFKVEYIEHQWLARVRLSTDVEVTWAKQSQHRGSNTDDREFTPNENNFDLIDGIGQLDLCEEEPYVGQVCWDGCFKSTSTAAYVRFTPRSFANSSFTDRLQSWAWPYLAPHPRVLHLMCTAGPNLMFFIGGLPQPVSDVLEWLRFDRECCALAYDDHQQLCFAIALQASALLPSHHRPTPFPTRTRRCQLLPAGGRSPKACSTCTGMESSTWT